MSKEKFAAATMLTCALLAPTARADFRFGVEGGVGFTDNLARVEDPVSDENIGVFGAQIDWQQQSRRINADVLIDLDYYDYSDDTYGHELLGTGDANIEIAIVPEKFKWLFQDSFGQAQDDPFAPSTPGTRENVNYFTTGPEASFRMSSANVLRVTGHYSSVFYDVTPLDSQRGSALVMLAHEFSAASQVAVNASYDRVEFVDSGQFDYNQKAAFASYQLHGSRTTMDGQLGYSAIEDAATGDDDGGLLFSLSLTRELTQFSSLLLDVGTQFTDSAEALRDSVANGGTTGGARSVGDVAATGDPYEDQHASLGWQFGRHRTDFTLRGSWNQERYETQTQLDRTRLSFDAGVRRQFTPTFDGSLTANYMIEESDATGIASNQLDLGLNFGWRFARTLSLRLDLEHDTRTSDDGAGEYTENRALLTMRYEPRGRVGETRARQP